MAIDLVAVLTAKTDGFEASLNRAATAAESASSQIKGSTDKISAGFEILKGLAAGVGAALSVNAFVGMIKGSIDAADHLNDLSKKTGIGVVELGGLGFAAEQSGGNLESMAKGAAKLNISLAQAASGNKLAKEAFDLLKISVVDATGNTKKADVVMGEIATKFASFNEGPEKAAVANRIFGKSYTEIIAILDEGGKKLQENIEYYKRYSGVTQELAEKSDQFNDTLTKVHLLSGAFSKQLASELLPSLQSVADQILETKEKGTLFKELAEALGTAFSFLVIELAGGALAFRLLGSDIGGALAKADLFFEKIKLFSSLPAAVLGVDVGGLVNQVKGLANLDIPKFSAISDAMSEDTKKAKSDYLKFASDIKTSKAFSGFNAGLDEFASKIGAEGKEKTDMGRLKPTGRGAGGAVKADDPDKKILDQQLKTLELFVSSERDLLQSRNTFLDLYYQNSEVSIASYFATRSEQLAANLAATKSAYAQEIAEIEKYIAKTRQKNDPKEVSKVTEAQTKIIEIRSKLSKVEEEASISTTKSLFAQDKAVEQYQDNLASLGATIRALKGDSAGAFEISFNIDNRSLTKQIERNKASSDAAVSANSAQAEIDLAEKGRLGLASAKLNDLERERSNILGKLSNAQDRINIAVSSGAATELQALAASSQANRDRIASLTAVVEAYERIAEASKDEQAIVAADRLRVELERLQSQTDLVGDKFRELGVNATDSFIEKLASGTVKLKDAFKSLFADINAQLLKIASRNIAETLLGKSGALSDFAPMLSKVFGGGGTGSTAGGGGGAIPSAGGAISEILLKLGIGSSAGVAAKGAAGAGLQAGATGAFDVGGSTGAIAGVAKAAAANDAAFTQLTTSVTASNTAMTALSTTTPIVDTALAAVSATTTTTLEASLLALQTAATAAAAALSTIAASSGASAASSAAGSIGIEELIASLAAKGNVYAGGNVIPFARGGEIVNRPTTFQMARGRIGLMGEAGPEAIFPLRKGPDGRLGISVTTPFSQGGVVEQIFPLIRSPDGNLGVMAFARGGVPSRLDDNHLVTSSKFTSDVSRSTLDTIRNVANELNLRTETAQHYDFQKKVTDVVNEVLLSSRLDTITKSRLVNDKYNVTNEKLSKDVSIHSEVRALPAILRDVITKFSDIRELKTSSVNNSSKSDDTISTVAKNITESNTTLNQLIRKSSLFSINDNVQTTTIARSLIDFEKAATSASGALSAVASPITGILRLSALPLSVSASAIGNVFAAGNVIPFARGGIVDTPTVFPMAKGAMGLMGEAGPEAIVPLRRGKDGRLGIEAPSAPSSPSNVQHINIVYQAAPGENMRTASQRGAEIARQLQIAGARNG